ncbi:unnamed protein product [Acanthoscelides obtectus]|nr:unnamed protein product [Acanthoscelides obtectus]CAK1664875.1 Probable aminopeptidase NPEPL1 [Acanthoscelides obtectus]
MSTKLLFHRVPQKSDPMQTPVLILGQLNHLTQLKFDNVRCKLEPRVTEETFKLGISSLHPSPTDTCSLYLNLATVAALPLRCSRHNTPSRAHAVTKLVQAQSVGLDEAIVIVCQRRDILASACAVARAFPVFTMKSKNDSSSVTTVAVEFVIVPDNEDDAADGNQSLSEEEVALLDEITQGVRLAARIVDTPCNMMNVDHFLEEIKKVGKALKLIPTIIRGEQLAEKGLGGIYGVGKAAEVPPALAILSHTPPNAQKTVAWVGKGIVYDTGGMCLKGRLTMPGMKRDCGGAAGILGAFYAAVKANFQHNLHAVFCLAENSIGPKATRPDDIHRLYSGRTVEINNTDAEGRLVLADGVVYAQRDLKAEVILDMATLTGAQGITTGKYHGAVQTNNGDWEDSMMTAGKVSGDLVFPLMYCPELHFSEFNSAMADMKNSVADRNNSQSSCAGLFIASHLGFDYPGTWIHVDMADTVCTGERATGYGVALLTTLFGSWCNHPLLQEISPGLDEIRESNAKKPRTKL